MNIVFTSFPWQPQHTLSHVGLSLRIQRFVFYPCAISFIVFDKPSFYRSYKVILLYRHTLINNTLSLSPDPLECPSMSPGFPPLTRTDTQDQVVISHPPPLRHPETLHPGADMISGQTFRPPQFTSQHSLPSYDRNLLNAPRANLPVQRFRP